MAQSGNGSNTTLGFIVGALVVVVAGLVWFIFSGGDVPGADEPEIQIDLPNGN
ncbi:hypothetical protein [Pseudooceanicola nanhaiensis]|uniref:hypothetical protein n=1 Tax=Pseudooceanicola nanhaiensis TaxID=375761 RepID=UPI001CD473B4|nr:hypothetical protein [Pseudooceanicola nanhaiensis]MCA0921528.1 hypothetical protein [Pseudooceanicola nanhaiensis]